MFTGGAEPALTAARHHRQVQGEQQTNRLVPPSSPFEDGTTYRDVFIDYGTFVPFGKITTIQPTCCLEKVAGFGAAMHEPIELSGDDAVLT